MASFFSELKRRNVFKVGVAYLIVAWLIAQVVAVFNAPLNLPDWFDTVVAVLLIIGFPLALFFAWAFELTPEGLKTSKSVEPSESITKQTGQKLNYSIITLLSIAVVFMVLDNYILEEDSSTLNAGVSTEVENSPQIESGSGPEGISNALSETSDRLPNSVAILPFDNLSLDPENAFFAAGIHESTLNQLAKISGLRVMARTSVMQFANDPPPITEIAEILNVETVMEGSVRYAQGRVLITAQLIEGETGVHLWSGEFNRELADVFSVQAEVAREIASAMQVQLLPEEQATLESRPTDSDEAYRHYLYAMSLQSGPQTREAFKFSMLEAIEADPNFAEAYGWLGFIEDMLGNIDSAIEYANKALELDPASWAGLFALGNIYFDYHDRKDEALSYLERSARLNPNDPNASMTYCYRSSDYKRNFSEIIPYCQRAVELDPTDELKHRQYATVLMNSGQLEEAMREVEEAIEIDPNDFYEAYIDRATIEFINGNDEAAKDDLDLAFEIMPQGTIYRADYAAYIYGLLGHVDIARRLLSQFERNITENDRQTGRTLGWAILGTRDKDRALDDWQNVIDGYINEGVPVSPQRIHRFRDNWLDDPMLEEPEFLELRRRVGFDG